VLRRGASFARSHAAVVFGEPQDKKGTKKVGSLCAVVFWVLVRGPVFDMNGFVRRRFDFEFFAEMLGELGFWATRRVWHKCALRLPPALFALGRRISVRSENERERVDEDSAMAGVPTRRWYTKQQWPQTGAGPFAAVRLLQLRPIAQKHLRDDDQSITIEVFERHSPDGCCRSLESGCNLVEIIKGILKWHLAHLAKPGF